MFVNLCISSLLVIVVFIYLFIVTAAPVYCVIVSFFFKENGFDVFLAFYLDFGDFDGGVCDYGVYFLIGR